MTQESASYRGDDKLLFGIILGVLAFWLFAQTTLNIAPAMAADLAVATDVMNIAVSITALFSGIFSEIGWTNPITWGLAAGAIVVGVMFFKTEARARNPFVTRGDVR